MTRYLGKPPRRHRITRGQLLFWVLLPAFVLCVVLDHVLTASNAEAQEVPQATPTNAIEAPPSVRECQQEVIGDTCYILERGECLRDCPAGFKVVEGDPPAIKKSPPTKKVGAIKKHRRPRQKPTPPPESQPPPKAAPVPVGAVLPA